MWQCFYLQGSFLISKMWTSFWLLFFLGNDLPGRICERHRTATLYSFSITFWKIETFFESQDTEIAMFDTVTEHIFRIIASVKIIMLSVWIPISSSTLRCSSAAARSEDRNLCIETWTSHRKNRMLTVNWEVQFWNHLQQRDDNHSIVFWKGSACKTGQLKDNRVPWKEKG